MAEQLWDELEVEIRKGLGWTLKISKIREKLKARHDDLKTDCDGFQKLASESTLRGAENRKKLEAIEKLHKEYGWLTTTELKEILGDS